MHFSFVICYKNYVFILQYMRRKKSKRWLVDFSTFIAVTLEHIHILITPARKTVRENIF